MKPTRTTGAEVASGVWTDDRLPSQVGLDVQLVELFETVWACERQWTIDDHVDAAIKYGAIMPARSAGNEHTTTRNNHLSLGCD